MPEWLAYRHLLAVGSVVVFFTAACDYVYFTGLTPVPPLYWILAFAALALPLVLTPRTASFVLDSRLTLWCGFYAAFTIVAFMWSAQSAAAWGEVRLRILAVLFLATMLLILADARVHQVTRLTLLGCVVLGVMFNVIDLARPLTFSSTPGRSAGLYVNPNISASALVLGMTVTVDLLPRAVRPWFVSFVGGGVLLTFSRGGAVTWGIASALIVALGGMGLGPFLRVAAATALGVIGGLAVTGLWDNVVQMASFVTSDAWERLRVGTGMMDASAETRLGDASRAWHMFVDRPLFGWGVGATAAGEGLEAPHNMYLRHLAEYGVGGAAIIPLLVWAVVARASAERNRVAVWVSGVVLVWSMFSHNLLDERHFLICLALAVAIAKSSETGAPAEGLARAEHGSHSAPGAQT